MSVDIPFRDVSTFRWKISHECKAVTLHCVGLDFGLVGIDRFIIQPLFPVMAQELKLDDHDLGQIASVRSIAWSVAAIVVFSVLAVLGSLAAGVVSLMAIHPFMGLAKGAYKPASIVATLDASKLSRQGLNIGIRQMALSILGLSIAPVLVMQLLKVVEWHWIFAIVSIPGLILAYRLYRVLRDTSPALAALHFPTHNAPERGLSDVFKSVPARSSAVASPQSSLAG